jgi:outer membrane lipoprotein carrier protein
MWPLTLSLAHADPVPAPAAGGTVDPVALIARIEARYQGIRSLSGAFVQTVKSGVYGDDTQSGSLLLERPNHMRWQVDGADGRLFVADGAWLWMYSPSDGQVVKVPQVEGAGGADVLLESLAHLTERFTHTFTPPPPGGTWHLVLVPRDPTNPYRQYEVGLSADLVLEELILVDEQGTVTRMEFRGVSLGTPAPAGSFSFTPPAGVEVVALGSTP